MRQKERFLRIQRSAKVKNLHLHQKLSSGTKPRFPNMAMTASISLYNVNRDLSAK